MKRLLLCATLICATLTQMNARSNAQITLARNGKPVSVILTQAGAIPSERYAAEELATHLQAITGAKFEVKEASDSAPENAIILGRGNLTRKYFPTAKIESAGAETAIIQTQGSRLLLSGGRPRGTLYATYRLLSQNFGVRWWTPWATDIPKKRSLQLPALKSESTPAFESRDPYWMPAFNGAWAARNASNSHSGHLSEREGGAIRYKGFVHTFYPLIPPEEYFATHPEWYSLLKGKRTTANAQLCLTNPELRDKVVERVRAWLKETPEASIVSVSQNDWYGACECPTCKALDDAEGGHSGTVLAMANYVAAKIKDEFPHVAIDTLAYQYTRKAPKTLKPLPNVIVRLCSIECNFGASLEDKSNAAFANDIRAWGEKSQRLYIWDYTTNFAHYVLPHPNWFVLGENVRFFHKHGVRGLFEQGAYQSHGAEMAEMRAWVLAQLLWNPYQDDKALIREFLNGYYGKASAPYIWQYLELLSKAAKGVYLTCYNAPGAPFLRYPILSQAEKLWQKAEEAAAKAPEKLWRVRQGHLAVQYTALYQWQPLRRECVQAGATWVFPDSRRALAEHWLANATGAGPKGWSPMTHINEPATTPQAFVARFKTDPPLPKVIAPNHRSKGSSRPADVPEKSLIAIDAQDELARLINEGDGAERLDDAQASDNVAVRMPNTHREWFFQLSMEKLPARAFKDRWKIYAVVRIEKKAGIEPVPDSIAFTAGVYDTKSHDGPAQISVRVGDAKVTYRSFVVGTIALNKDQYFWFAPEINPSLAAVWIDRIYLVPQP